MFWDPLGRWPNERRWVWLAFAGWLLFLQGPALLTSLQTTAHLVPDFFQDYASARNWFDGLPIYTGHDVTAPRYLGLRLDPRGSYVFVNAHPPASVLIFLPLAGLHFSDAFLVWNILSLAALGSSLWVVQRQLEIPFSLGSLAPLLAMLLICSPLWEQCRLGQHMLVLLLLVTGTWAAERSGRPWLAGALLGTAASIKLFPAFLLFYYGLVGRWKVVTAALLSVAGLTCLSVIVLGVSAHRSYLFTVLPEIEWFRAGWNNDSVWGFWSRLFDPAPERHRIKSLSAPLYYSPVVAKAMSLISCGAIVAVLIWAVRRDPRRERGDLTFALAVTSMLLVSPICWDHYLLLLLVPLAVVWAKLPESPFIRALFLAVVASFWLGYPLVWRAFDLVGRTATPIQSILVLSYQFYALLGLLAIALTELRLGTDRSLEPATRITATGILSAGAPAVRPSGPGGSNTVP